MKPHVLLCLDFNFQNLVAVTFVVFQDLPTTKDAPLEVLRRFEYMCIVLAL